MDFAGRILRSTITNENSAAHKPLPSKNGGVVRPKLVSMNTQTGPIKRFTKGFTWFLKHFTYLIDRMLETRAVEKAELQLIGISCMLAASKCEEIYAAGSADFEYITDNEYDKGQILEMERTVIHAASFDLARPHSIQFLRSLVKRYDYRAGTYQLAKYICESCLLDHTTCYMLPSQQACASLYIASKVKNDPLNAEAVESSYRREYTMNRVKEWAAIIAESMIKLDVNHKLKVLKSKFATLKCQCVSEFSASDREALSAVAANL